jgi:hypothetical protein
VNGACRSQCTSTTQCPANHVCQIGYCLPSTGQTCTVNCDCRSGERCVNGYCAP